MTILYSREFVARGVIQLCKQRIFVWAICGEKTGSGCCGVFDFSLFVCCGWLYINILMSSIFVCVIFMMQVLWFPIFSKKQKKKQFSIRHHFDVHISCRGIRKQSIQFNSIQVIRSGPEDSIRWIILTSLFFCQILAFWHDE